MSYRVDDVDVNSQQVKLLPSPNIQIVPGARDTYSTGTAGEVAQAQCSLLTYFMSSVELNLYLPRQTFVGFTAKLYIL
jgi:hypothetical protein